MNPGPRDGRILIVDDIAANLQVVADFLAGCGYEVFIAQDGGEALERASLARPDLILLDVLLPDASGFDVCRRLKRQPGTADIPVIFMTALVDTEHKLEGFAAGGIDYVTKPLDLAEMLARIDTHMRLRWLQRQLEEKNAELERSHAELERRVAERTVELSEANHWLRLEIEERKQAEERLALKNFALDHVRDAAYLIDDVGQILYVNDAGCRMTGYRQEELLAMRISALDPDWSDEIYRERWPRLRQLGNVAIESRHRRKNGQEFPVEMSANYFEYGGHGYNLSLVRDISESKAAEAALRASERKFRTLAENSPDLLIRYDRACRRVYVNPAYMTLFGLSEEQALARTLGEGWYGGVDAREYEGMLRSVMATGVRAESFMTWKSPGAAPMHYIFHMVPEYDADGTVLHVLTIGRDITPLKEAERSLHESRSQLRELAARQQTAREEERKHIARELHDELGQFLTALRMSVSLLRVRFGQDNPALTAHAKDMTELVDRNIQVVRNVAASLRPAALDMGIQSALEWLVDEFAGHAGIAATLHVEDDGIVLDEDSGTAVFRIVQESLTNVARHADASHVTVTLDSSGGHCQVTVQDDGMGFHPARVRKTSLGLVGMRERVLMVGGEIAIDSMPGRGTTVVVRVPLDRQAGQDARAASY
jgi:PAS domain S-box-containing protein